jgi:hypothetical protein
MWRCEDLAEAVAGCLRGRAAELDLEQAVRGIDALTEVELHPFVREGLAKAGFGVLAEQPYPGDPERRPLHRERERCDVVLLPIGTPPGAGLADPVEALKGADALSETLFADVGRRAGRPGREVAAATAFWLEVKSVGQYAFVSGVPGANGAYASELVRGPALDAAKLSRDPMIEHGGVLVVLFTDVERTAVHDLGVMVHKCLDRDLPVCEPVSVRFGITDRIGNGVCSVSLIRVRPERA